MNATFAKKIRKRYDQVLATHSILLRMAGEPQNDMRAAGELAEEEPLADVRT